MSWDEIDLPDALVAIEWNLTRVTSEGLRRVLRMKSAAGERELPLPAFAWRCWSGGRRRAVTCCRCSRTRPAGWRDPSNTQRALREARGTQGFAWVTSHVFRKTCATTATTPGCPRGGLSPISPATPGRP